jgi:ABC-type oligopeptide transport system ATPase subunit
MAAALENKALNLMRRIRKKDIYESPQYPYTQSLLAAIPSMPSFIPSAVINPLVK